MGSTFYDGGNSEMQSSADGGLQTLYLMNPTTTYVPYSDVTTTTCTSTPNPNMLLLNLPTLSHAPPPPPPHQHQHLLGLTIPTTHHNHQDIPSFHYNLWPSPSSILDHHPTPSSPAAAAARRPTTPHHPQQQQALSLSLSDHFNKPRAPTNGGDDIEIPSNWSVVLGSKYLKAAQEVLDEVVNVGKAIDDSLDMDGSRSNNNKDMIIKSQSQSPSNNITADPSTHHHQPQPELTTAQTQELQMKKSKLVHMLDEVEQRYRQYRQQMQIVICSLEQAAGYGAAKSYTAVALRTISKQFRCLKDAISSQIKATSKSLGEDYDCLGGKIEGSRLRYVDHHLRQQRALQQLGMIQHNAWRPQRGLPERAVSILRAWLFEHFLHPYPKDSDKVMLAKQTGLTRSQVSNWFINARVRLWKPMVEEMYLEETKEQQGEDQEQNINNNNNGASNSTKDISSKDQSMASNNNNNNMNGAVVMLEESSSAGGGGNNNMMMMRSLDQMKALQSKSDHHHHHHQRFSINNQTTNNNSSLPSSSSSNSGMGLMGSAGGGVGNINNVSVMDVEMKPANNNKYISVGVGTNYAGFSMQDIGRFNINNDNHTNNVSDHHQQQQHLAPRFHGNGVSLTLGLPHSNDHHNQLPLSLSATQHGFLSHHHHHHRNIHLGSNNNNGSSSSDQFCAITATPQSSHHNSAGTATYDNIDIQNTKNFAAQLLPDFVT